MVRRICKMKVTLEFIFRLVLCSREDVLFSIICLNVLEGIKQFYLLMWFKKKRLGTPFKGDNVKALIETPNCENLVHYFSEKVQKIATFAMLFWFSVTKQPLENGVGFHIHKFRKTFYKFYRRYCDLISKFQVGLESLLRQGLSEPQFYGDMVYKLKNIIGSNNFSAQFIKIMYCSRLHAWWSTQSKLALCFPL